MADNKNWHRDEETGQYVHAVSVEINAPVENCFRHWAQFELFPNIMRHIKQVVKTAENRWHWKAEIGNQHLEWDAIMPDFVQNKIIAWRSTQGVENSGTVSFVPSGDGGCLLSVHIMYNPPYGIFGDIAAALGVNQQFHDNLVEDLNNFKEAVESGRLDMPRAA